MRKIILVLVLPLSLFAQELVGTFSIDSSIYENIGRPTGIRGPNNEAIAQPQLDGINQRSDMLLVWHKKVVTNMIFFHIQEKLDQ
ncbi:MAG: hypothetical protein JW768_07955 [Chitinispirillaceae bacterium]|nr:hypothetical protein [Chitinispirillaceae bacterium]